MKNPSNPAAFFDDTKIVARVYTESRQEPESLNRHPFNLRSDDQFLSVSRIPRQRVVDTAFVAL